ncbi:MAG: hypothetical protein KKD44_29580 [Proteobacteria bacterium]|nr:hypothetical protein [Pseudomonadota bacterium]
MASGLRGLRKIEIGEEGTKGTAVPATAGLVGVLTMKESPTIHRPVEERGQLAEFSRSVKVGNLAELTLESDVTFEQILWLLHMGVLGNVTPVTAGAPATANRWTFTPAMAAAGVFDSFTIEYGDDIEQWESEYCMASAIEISGAMNEPMKVRGDIFGRKMTVCNFTGNAPPVVESVLTQKARLYIDDETGKIGGTLQADTLISFTYRINTGLGFKRFADGSIDFSSYGENFKGVELRMTFAFNAGAEVERLKFDGSTQRIVRIEALGSAAQAKEDSLDEVGAGGWTDVETSLLVTNSALFTADRVIIVETERILVTAIGDATHITGVRGYEGTTKAAHAAAVTIYFVHDKRLVLDFCGIYTDWATLSERDGEDVVEVTMSPERGTTYTKLFEVGVENATATLI